MAPEYTVERYDSPRFGIFGALRYHWRLRHRNGNVLAYSNQGHSRKIDRDSVTTGLRDAFRPGMCEIEDVDE